ncbi:MAG: putative transport system permease protein [Frankiaceae bacterium]|jgi:putative ABC transport system permease protein|nr:putative transport system permease protein [Frankiaceae bacterium]MDQ1673096.1 putative transport system permease protein [Frankiaceae bacterium]
MLRTTLRSLFARKLRLVLSALAIVLGVGFVTGTLVLTDTLNRTFNNLFSDIDKNTSVKIRAKSNLADTGADQSSGASGGSGRPVPASLLGPVRAVPGVAEAEGTVQGFAVLTERPAPPVAGQPPRQAPILSNENAPPIGVAFNASTLSPLHVDSGTPPAAAGDIAVDRGTFDQKKLRLGQNLAVATQSGLSDVRLVGTFRFGSSNNLAGATLIAFTPPDAQRLLLQPGQLTDITVGAAPGVTQEELQSRIAAVVPPEYETLTGKQIIKENADSLAKGLGSFSTFLQAFGYISLFVGAFIISNTFSMLIAQRVRELALLRALGASKRQVRRSVIVEALLVGVVGSTLGLAFGFGVAVLLKALLGAFGVELPAGGVVFAPRTVLVAYVIGTVTTLLAALGPAIRAARVPPIAAMRDVEMSPTGNLRNRTLSGATLLAAGVALILLGFGVQGSGALGIVGGGAAAVFLGVATLSPLISRPVIKVIGAPFASGFGTVGRLSQENARRNPRRTSSTAAALMIGLALVSAFSVFGTSIKTSIRDLFGESLKADFIVTGGGFNQQPFSPELAGQLRRLPDVSAVSQLRFAQVTIDGTKANVNAVNPEGLTDVLNLQREEGRFDLAGQNMLVSSKVLADKKWKVGQTVTVRWAETGDRPFQIAGTFQQNQLAGEYVVPLSAYDANVTTKLDSIVLVKAATPAALPAVRSAITQALVPYPNLDVRDQKEFVADNARQIDQILGLVTALLTFAIVIATFGIINTLLLSVVERTREIGLLRAVGLQRRQTRVMIRLEAIMIAVYGGVLGLAVGSFFGWALTHAFTKESEFGSFHYPFVQLLIFLLVSGVLGVLAAIIPAWRASRINVLQAIATT